VDISTINTNRAEGKPKNTDIIFDQYDQWQNTWEQQSAQHEVHGGLLWVRRLSFNSFAGIVFQIKKT